MADQLTPDCFVKSKLLICNGSFALKIEHCVLVLDFISYISFFWLVRFRISFLIYFTR